MVITTLGNGEMQITMLTQSNGNRVQNTFMEFNLHLTDDEFRIVYIIQLGNACCQSFARVKLNFKAKISALKNVTTNNHAIAQTLFEIKV